MTDDEVEVHLSSYLRGFKRQQAQNISITFYTTSAQSRRRWSNIV